MREWKLKLEKEGITEARYMELKAMAKRYGELKKLDGKWRRGEMDRCEGGNTQWHGHSDPTAREGERLASNPLRRLSGRRCLRMRRSASGC